MSEGVVDAQAFKLKGRLYTLPVMYIFNDNWDKLTQQLTELVQKAPRLFDNTPVVLDCSLLTTPEFDLAYCCQLLRQFGMCPVAIQGGTPELLLQAHQCQIPQLHASGQQDKALFESKSSEEVPHEPQESSNQTHVYSLPIRSGQRIVSKEGNLVVTTTVSHGAELLAEGHIHVYGTLRGRALAGMTGDKQARIFCQALDAELVAIAGIYCLSEQMQSITGPCQIFLRDEHIHIEPL